MTTEEKNETPAAKEPENPWAFLESPPKEPEHDDDVLRLKDVSKSWLAGYILKKGCLTLLVIFVALVGCDMILTSSRYHYEAKRIRTNAMYCLHRLKQIGIGLSYLAYPDKMPETLRDKTEPVEITPDMTVADLIRETLRQDILDEWSFRCPQSREPYLVFPVPASALLQEDDPRNPHKRIPIVMDLPDAHDESKSLTFVCRLFYGRSAECISTARVLYADGGIVSISRKEAEELVRKYHPEPLKLSQDGTAGEIGIEDAARKE